MKGVGTDSVTNRSGADIIRKGIRSYMKIGIFRTSGTHYNFKVGNNMIRLYVHSKLLSKIGTFTILAVIN